MYWVHLAPVLIDLHVTSCAAQVVELAIPELELARVAHVVVIGAEMALAHRSEVAVPALRRQCALNTAHLDPLHATELASRHTRCPRESAACQGPGCRCGCHSSDTCCLFVEAVCPV